MARQQARKRFGQNFLHEKGVIRHIIDSIGPGPEDHFVEIGPGRGAITRELAARARKLDVVEIDRDLAAELHNAEWAVEAGVTIHTADALEFDFASLSDTESSLRLAGNLPYNISTPLLFHFLEAQKLFSDIHVMLQKEVVQRMTADPGSKNYGRLTVALAARCRVESLFNIGSGAFSPAPKVGSAFVRLIPLASPLVSENELPAFDAVLREAFGKRRKQLANALQTLLSADAIEAAGIDPMARAETLPVEDFAALGRQLQKQSPDQMRGYALE
ncbi:MAG: 16S rRNA (adenine(1518)-N(6)/adenine(1519)-N(6))-dimethyltransferase RsmA [Gammaproteobacteria bacterium]|jgi:16S rRNA (adenine1518-N6/adenine1519-N6)-dimethyltransferase|nr:16S rRNA (adenine(1518)-N(6)/adenine(1519)-N(6))-dimethyltransferase RsmA [Gammaproteobacteria bacterium]MDP6616197.1 16S rRNA (adenine(1518)-N(6)/adenine(1519)-N(6))-dimethyltransferase RsmA [Gammaproteobacteria bacterium]MDP6695595.1 16S rRNA (adenine(1518)-N(6)/adenine(1519)-N(6))-dimethyltransferase RsmA [Gammaproteobacteria bacterium]MDP7041721.1 16S rRNA (adenine(1518)-N(6)/adenine(1519)-N(6))-dimethyltransferase RsmA [Gammaproteobacteria bacterium]